MAARRWEAAAEEATAVAVMGTREAERAAGPSPAGAAGLEAVTGLDMAAVTVEATEGERLAEEATMPAAEATAAMVQVAATTAPVKGTPEVGYLPAEATSVEATTAEAKNGRTRRPAERRRTMSTGKPAAAGPAAPAAARSPPAARRTPPAAAGAGRDPRTRSPSAPRPATASTAAVSRARAGRGSAAPRRRPDLPPAGRSRQLSGLRATALQSLAAATAAREDPGLPRRRRAPDHAALDEAARQRAQRHQTKRAAATAGQDPSLPRRRALLPNVAQCSGWLSVPLSAFAELASCLPCPPACLPCLPLLPWCPRLDLDSREKAEYNFLSPLFPKKKQGLFFLSGVCGTGEGLVRSLWGIAGLRGARSTATEEASGVGGRGEGKTLKNTGGIGISRACCR